MFTNIIQRISGLINLLFPKKTNFKLTTPKKSKSRYALYTYLSVKRDILDLKHGKMSKTIDLFIEYIHTLSPSILIYVPSTTYTLRMKKNDHMRDLVLIYENILSSTHTICIDTIKIKSRYIQHKLKRKDRFTKSKEKFYLSNKFERYIIEYKVKHVICIDDVTTTGATRFAIEELFLKYGISVQFIAIASQD